MLALTVKAAAPVASFTVDGKTITNGHITVSKNETVCFTSTSTDPDGDSLKYRWTFGDGGDTSGAANPCHTYRSAGSYTIKLRVSDKRDSMPFLTGKTPANYSLPSSWSLVIAQDFESGAVGSSEYMNGSTITTNNPIAGNYSAEGRVYKDDRSTGWVLRQNITTGTEIYVSWYEYIDRQGKNNDETMLFAARKEGSGGNYMFCRWQYLNHMGSWATAFNLDTGRLVLFCEGDTGVSTVSKSFAREPKNWINFGAGRVRQWEVYWKPATNNEKNGTTRIYLNGILKEQFADTTFNFNYDMTGASIYIGGPTYTKINWGDNERGMACAENIGQCDGGAAVGRPKNFKWPIGCQNQAPPDGYVPIFRRFIDNIIVAQRGN